MHGPRLFELNHFIKSTFLTKKISCCIKIVFYRISAQTLISGDIFLFWFKVSLKLSHSTQWAANWMGRCLSCFIFKNGSHLWINVIRGGTTFNNEKLSFSLATLWEEKSANGDTVLYLCNTFSLHPLLTVYANTVLSCLWNNTKIMAIDLLLLFCEYVQYFITFSFISYSPTVWDLFSLCAYWHYYLLPPPAPRKQIAQC